MYMAVNHYIGLQKLFTIAIKMQWDEAIAQKKQLNSIIIY